MLRFTDEELAKLGDFIPKVAKLACTELLQQCFALAGEFESPEELMEVAQNFATEAQNQPDFTESQLKGLKDIDIDLGKVWELPVDAEKWAPLFPWIDSIHSAVPEGEDPQKYFNLVVLGIGLRNIAQIKFMENQYLASNSGSYEQFIEKVDPWLTSLNQMVTILKYRDSLRKAFDTRIKQYRGGKESGMNLSEAKQELLQAAVEEAVSLRDQKTVANPKQAARHIVFDWRSNPIKAKWLEDESGKQLYQDPEATLEREIRKAAIFPNRGRGRPPTEKE